MVCKNKSVLQNLAVTIHSADVFILKIVLGMSMPQFTSLRNTCEG